MSLHEEENINSISVEMHTVIGCATDGTMFTDEFHILMLLAQGADPNFTHNGYTVLGLACLFGHESLVDILLRHGADPNLQLCNGQKKYLTPLHLVSGHGKKNKTIVSMLLRYGADVNIVMANGNTPLHCATIAGHEDIITEILTTTSNYDDNDVIPILSEDALKSCIAIAREHGVSRRNIHCQLMKAQLQSKSQRYHRVVHKCIDNVSRNTTMRHPQQVPEIVEVHRRA